VKKIMSTNGYEILVDNDDYEKLKDKKYWTCPKRNYCGHYTLNKGKPSYISIHREIMNPPKNMQVDHKNGNKLDNRKCNLRICSQSQNNFNIRKQTSKVKKFTSKYKGVSYDVVNSKNNPWKALITIKGKSFYLGNYPKEEYAAVAYNAATRLIAKEFFKGNLL